MPNGPPDPDAVEDMPSPDASTRAPDNRSVVLNVHVPGEAKILVNGKPTTSTGAERLFISRGLEPGRTYAYELQAEIERDGEVLTETKEIRLTAGRRTNVSFGFNSDRVVRRPVAGDVRTTLILNVPKDAKVVLAGRETTSKGPVREFTTTKLTGEGQWANYPIRVEMTVDGEMLVEERTVSLAAGETRELTIDFDATQVARVPSDLGL